MDKNIIIAAAILIPALLTVYFDMLISIIFFAFLAAGLVYTKKIGKRDASLAGILFLIFLLFFHLYYLPSLSVAQGQGTVLSDNWYQALTWMKSNTAECAVVATYWDPGHFITGIARRAVVFDGASQSNPFSRAYNYTQAGLVVEKYDANINHIVLYENGNKTTARIQDISTTLLTSNETLAISILKEYMKPGCNEMYYIASADLIPKSTWWTYFATWNPVDKKGTPYVYATIALGNARPDLKQNAIIYSYPVSQQQAFVMYLINDTPMVFLQQQGTAEPIKVEKFIYFDKAGNGRMFSQEDAEIKGLIYIEPGNQMMIFIPPELENALFTRMFLFNGAGLQHFELVNSWGGEVKLFKVKFD
jgi:hypothetical protein